jgi:hypothetical protein
VVGGGGGKKIPPGGSPPPRPARSAQEPSTPPSKPVLESQPPAAEPVTAETPRNDSFEGFRAFQRGTSDVTKLDDAFLHTASPSGIENLVRMLDASRAQLAAEHRSLREQAHSVIERLVQSGFAPAQLERAKKELQELRKKMAALRKRLHHLQRRLKSAFASAGKTGDGNFVKLLGAQLDRLKKLEPNLQRALSALSTIEQAYGQFDGATPILRVHVGEPDGEAASPRIGAAIAALAPGAVVARSTLAMLRDGPAALPEAEAGDVVDAPGLDGFRALGDALRGSK